MISLVTKIIDIKGTPKQIFEQFKSTKIREWYPDMYIAYKNERVDCNLLKNTGAQYVIRIKKKKPYKLISGTLEPVLNDNSEKLNFEWKFKSAKLQNGVYWTQMYMEFKIPNNVQNKQWWLAVIIPAVIASSELGFTNMPSAYANTISHTVTNSAIVDLLIAKKKLILSLILLATAGGSTAILFDNQGPDIYLSYAVFDDTPIDYSGNSIVLYDFSSKDRSGIIDSGCSINEQHRIGIGDFVFNCWATDNSLFKNNSTKKFTVTVEEPDKSHWPLCVEKYLLIPEEYKIGEEVVNIDTYTDFYFNSIVQDYENKTGSLIISKEHTKARIESSILIDRINPHSAAGLSNFANAIRDENREEEGRNFERIDCAIEIHSMREIQAKAWGTLALAEDYFVRGNYPEAIKYSSKVIEQYPDPHYYVDENNYVNAFIIRGNSNLQLYFTEETKSILEEAEQNYKIAISLETEDEIEAEIEILKKSDPRLGLGIIEYTKLNFDASILLFEDARLIDKNNKDVNAWLVRAWLSTGQEDKAIDLLSSVKDLKLKEYLKKIFPYLKVE